MAEPLADHDRSTGGVRASLVVLTYEGWDVVAPCVRSLQAASGERDEIIVVDNGSTDGTVQNLRRDFPDVRVVALPENTYIFGLNAGLAVARGRYVAFLNNDMTVDAGFVDACCAVLDDDPDAFAACPRILDGAGVEQGSRTRGYWRHGGLHYASLRHVDAVTDCFFAVGGQSFFVRERLLEIGSIDELLWPMYHEDVELSYRAWKRGWTVRYAPAGVAHHLGSVTSKKVFTAVELRSFVRQNEFLIVWKDVTDRWLLLQHLSFLVPRLLAAVARRDAATLIGFRHAVQRLPAVRQARRDARRHARLSDREVLRRVGRIA